MKTKIWPAAIAGVCFITMATGAVAQNQVYVGSIIDSPLHVCSATNLSGDTQGFGGFESMQIRFKTADNDDEGVTSWGATLDGKTRRMTGSGSLRCVVTVEDGVQGDWVANHCAQYIHREKGNTVTLITTACIRLEDLED